MNYQKQRNGKAISAFGKPIGKLNQSKTYFVKDLDSTRSTERTIDAGLLNCLRLLAAGEEPASAVTDTLMGKAKHPEVSGKAKETSPACFCVFTGSMSACTDSRP